MSPPRTDTVHGGALGVGGFADLPPEIGLAVPEPVDADDVRTLEQVERDYIMSVLRTLGGNRSRAAAKLGIGTATLYRKLKAFGLGQ